MFDTEQTAGPSAAKMGHEKQSLRGWALGPLAPPQSVQEHPTMKTRIAAALVSIAAVLPFVFVAAPAQAQGYTRTGEPRIDGFDVAPVPRSVPGRELVFTLFGSPGGTAVVQIAGATGDLALGETETGVYQGSYTIRSRDRITAASKATVNLRVGNKVASLVLDEPLIGAANSGPSLKQRAAANGPRIDKFEIDAPQSLAAGEELFLTLNGTPAGTATARITGINGKVALSESRPGVYEGRYTIRHRDRLDAGSAATATLRVRDNETTASLGHSLQARGGPRAQARQAAPVCAACGVIESINQVQVQGEGTYLGKIGGGIAGALIGSQIGSGKGTTVAQIAGAAGGVLAGNEIEKRLKSTTHFEAVVRLDNGGTQTFSYPTQPGFAVGARVRADNGVLSAI
jgi:outer membrane lipoprotein SlyB